jgi:hypothetical protein
VSPAQQPADPRQPSEQEQLWMELCRLVAQDNDHRAYVLQMRMPPDSATMVCTGALL